MTAPLIIAMSQGKEITLLPQMANRHGLITGATGTGKTVTLQKMAESFAIFPASARPALPRKNCSNDWKASA